MLVALNGRLIPEAEARVSIFDRSFLYGDGLFETLLVRGGRPFRWSQHLRRMASGAEFLRIQLPFTVEELRGQAAELILRNKVSEGLLRISLSRGVGQRGYLPVDAGQPLVAMSLHTGFGSWSDCPGECRLVTAPWRLAA